MTTPSVLKDDTADNTGPDGFAFKRQFRWFLELDGIPSHSVRSIRTTENLFGPCWEIDYYIAQNTDILCHVAMVGSGVLKFLDNAGIATDEYDVSWDGRQHTPFLNLDYECGDNVLGRVVLNYVKISKRS